MPLSPSIEKYIRKIYLADSKEIKVTGSYLASELKISSAAITDMARKLNTLGLIKYQKHKEFKLTAKGKKAALKVVRKHRLWESFLHKSLGLNLEEIHAEAEILEHFGSRKLMNRIDKILDYPQYDPHGDPIPDSEGKLPEEQNYPSLNECEPGKYEIHRVYYDNSDVSNFFVEYDFKVGKLVELALHFKMDHAVLLKVDKTTIVINENIASKIFVKPVEE